MLRKIESELFAKSIVMNKHVNIHTSLLNFATVTSRTD